MEILRLSAGEHVAGTESASDWLKVRLHLGAYLLQSLYNLTDRKLEYQIRDNAAYQVFCGKGIVDGWHIPDHTKIEEFFKPTFPRN